jgi:hypothetical protein
VSAWSRAFRAVYLGFALLLFAGVPVILLSPRLAVFLLLAGVIGLFGMRLAFALVEYRRTMRRPWPRVPPLQDDDDEW